MKIAVHLARHRRLVALGGLSLLLHLLAFALIDSLVAPPPVQVGAPIALRLAHGQAPVAPAEPAATTAARRAPPAPAPERIPSPAPAPSPAQARAALPPMLPLLPAGEPAAAKVLPGITPGTTSAIMSGTAPLQMPGRYRVQLPPSVRIAYVLTRTAPGQPPAQGESAQLVWERSGGAYRLRLDGVLGDLASTGGEDDAGLAPSEAQEAGPAGGKQTTRFNRIEGRIEQELSASQALVQGSQDRASVLLQLAGIGMADPDQVQDSIDIVVAGGGGARIARWQVIGQEQLDTPAGAFSAMHLLQLAPAGEARVEVWLAPQRGWLPVQLRVTQPDGTVANQLATRIDAGAVPPSDR